MSLEGRVALVTGGSGHIGRAMVATLIEMGARVAMHGLHPAETQKAADLHGAACAPFPADLADTNAVVALPAAVKAKFGRLDILINNAGINIRKQPQEYTLAEWHKVLDSNLTSAFLCSHAAYPEMMKAGGGKMINIGSMMTIFGASFATAYAASKGGIVQMTKAMATAWAKDSIQVNAILPGWIDTALTKRARQDVPALHDSVLKRTPAGRWGIPDDFAGIAVFLAAAASDYVTGAAITVDGGYSVQG
jgi:2-deoxy-D-gluconate 3-dehydrogenase